MGPSPPRTVPSLPVARSYEGSEAGEGIGVRGDVEDGHDYAGVRTRWKRPREKETRKTEGPWGFYLS